MCFKYIREWLYILGSGFLNLFKSLQKLARKLVLIFVGNFPKLLKKHIWYM